MTDPPLPRPHYTSCCSNSLPNVGELAEPERLNHHRLKATVFFLLDPMFAHGQLALNGKESGGEKCLGTEHGPQERRGVCVEFMNTPEDIPKVLSGDHEGYSWRQDNNLWRVQPVFISPLRTRRTEFFGGTIIPPHKIQANSWKTQ